MIFFLFCLRLYLRFVTSWWICRVMRCCHGLMLTWRGILVPSQRRTWEYGFLKRHHRLYVLQRWIVWLVKVRVTSKVSPDQGWGMIISLCHRLVLNPIPREPDIFGRNKQASISNLVKKLTIHFVLFCPFSHFLHWLESYYAHVLNFGSLWLFFFFLFPLLFPNRAMFFSFDHFVHLFTTYCKYEPLQMHPVFGTCL